MGLQPLTYQLVEEWRHDEGDGWGFPPPLTPPPGAGKLFVVRFFGAFAPKNRTVKTPPSPGEGGRGMGLQPLTYQLVEEWRHDEGDGWGFPPPLTPPPGAGKLFVVRFFGAFAPKNRTVKTPPSPGEGGRGMGLQPLTYQLVEEWRHDEGDGWGFPPPLTPPPGAGKLFVVRFFGAFAPKNRTVKTPPSPGEGGRGMGLQPLTYQKVPMNLLEHPACAPL